MSQIALYQSHAQRINQCHARVVAGLRTTLEAAHEAGRLLTEVRKQVPHGQWMKWCETHLDFSYRTAHDYQAIFSSQSKLQPTATLRDVLVSVRNGRKQLRDQERERYAALGNRIKPDQDFTYHHCDFRKAPIPDGSVDIVVIDPPWYDQSLPLYGAAAEVSARILRPGGLALIYVASRRLPEICRDTTPHLAYQWLMGFSYAGHHAGYAVERIKVRFRPVLFCSKGKPRDHHPGMWFYDHCQVDPKREGRKTTKLYHHWGQPLSPLSYWLERMSVPGDVICDLTLGSGTTAVATKQLGRRKFVGCDLDRQAIQTTKKRLAEMG